MGTPLTVLGPGPDAATAASAAEALAGTSPRFEGLYVHVPFCFHKCHYCDFYSFVDAEDRQEAYVERLERELSALARWVRAPLGTVFVGGGTPTLLRPPLLARALSAVRERLGTAPDAEWTVEANPETVGDEVAAVLAAAGVTRVSLGAQSFDPRHLRTLERWHDPASVGRAVACLRAAGIGRVSLDLIFGIPGQSAADWERDLDAALALGPDHLSCYGLTYEPNTAMTARLRRGEFEPCEDASEARMLEAACDRLAEAVFLSCALGIESLAVNQGIKRLFRRTRPTESGDDRFTVRTPSTSSFPSGHASSAVFAAILLVSFTGAPLAWIWILLAVAVAMSRVMVRIHHFTDIAAGAVTGAVLGTLALAASGAFLG